MEEGREPVDGAPLGGAHAPLRCRGQWNLHARRAEARLLLGHTPSLEAPANSVVAAVANQKPVMEWSGTPHMHDYKDTIMYYGAYHAYVYEGTPTPVTGVYGGMYYGYSLHDYSSLGHDGQMVKRGPRSGPFKNQQGVGATAAAPVKGQELSVSNGSPAAMKDQYNRAGFVETYSDAKFFITESCSEDDVHKSIKYNVWATTTNGSKKLDTLIRRLK